VSGFDFDNSAYEHEIRAMTPDCVECQNRALILDGWDCAGPFYTNFPGEIGDEVYVDTRYMDNPNQHGRAFGIGTTLAVDLVAYTAYYIKFDIVLDNENSISSKFRTYSQLSYKNPFIPCVVPTLPLPTPSAAGCVFRAGDPIFGVPGFENDCDIYWIQKFEAISHGQTVGQWWSPDLQALGLVETPHSLR